MRVLLGFILAILLAASAAAQEEGCATGCNLGQQESTISIPLGTLYTLIRSVLCAIQPETCPSFIAELVTGLLIPDLEITLHRDFVIEDFAVRCPAPCCPEGRKFYALPNVVVSGETKPIGVPPTALGLTFPYAPQNPVVDQEAGDYAILECYIRAGPFTIPRGGAKAALVLPVGITIPLWEQKGELAGKVSTSGCYVSYGCTLFLNQPPRLSVPREVKAVAGRATVIPIAVDDPDRDPVHVYIAPISIPGLELYYDRELGAYVVFVSSLYEGPEKFKSFADVWAYDLKPGAWQKLEPWESPKREQYYHEVRQWFSLVITRNHPPVAIDGSLTISHWEYDCSGPVRYEAYDPDLPDNFGFNLFFVSLGFPEGWGCDFGLFILPDTPGLHPTHCQGKTCEFSFSCSYIRCLWPDFPIPKGTYRFPFSVVEYNRVAMNPEKPENYGFADAGTWILVVDNQPPKATV